MGLVGFRGRVVLALVLGVVAGADGARGQGPKLPWDTFSDWNYYNNTGWVALDQGKYERAAQAFKIAIDRLRPYEATERALLARSYADYARVLHLMKHDEAAAPLARWALSVRDSDPKTRPALLAETLDLMGEIEVARRRYDAAEPLYRRALTVREKELGPSHRNLIPAVEGLARVTAARGKLEEAEGLYLRALALRDSNSDEALKEASELEQSARIIRQIAASGTMVTSPFQVNNQMTRATRLEARAKVLRESSAESVGTAVTAEGYAALLRRTGRADEADDLDARARAIRDAVETRSARARAER